MKNDINTVNTGSGILERLVSMLDKYGILKVLLGIFLMIILSYAVFISLNPGYFVSKYTEKINEEHNKQLTQRMEVIEIINVELENIKHKTNADRVFVIEFHNSVKSIEGFPFAFGSMNFETCQDNTYYVSDEYTNFNLSKYKLIPYIYKHNIYMGDIEGVKEIDNRLYYKFISNDVKRIYLIKIEGMHLPTGILGVSFCDEEDVVNDQFIMSTLRQEAVRLGVVMSNNQHKLK